MVQPRTAPEKISGTVACKFKQIRPYALMKSGMSGHRQVGQPAGMPAGSIIEAWSLDDLRVCFDSCICGQMCNFRSYSAHEESSLPGFTPTAREIQCLVTVQLRYFVLSTERQQTRVASRITVFRAGEDV